MATYAGQYGPEPLIDTITSELLFSATVLVRLAGSSTSATLYTDRTMSTAAANPLTVGVPRNTTGLSVDGNLLFWAEPGRYDLIINGGTPMTVVVPLDPEDIGDTSDFLAHLEETVAVHGSARVQVPTVAMRLEPDIITTTADSGTEFFTTSTAHALVNGQKVFLRRTSAAGSVPGGVTENAIYYVKSATSTTFQLSELADLSTTVNLTNAGTASFGVIPMSKYDLAEELNTFPAIAETNASISWLVGIADWFTITNRNTYSFTPPAWADVQVATAHDNGIGIGGRFIFGHQVGPVAMPQFTANDGTPNRVLDTWRKYSAENAVEEIELISFDDDAYNDFWVPYFNEQIVAWLNGDCPRSTAADPHPRGAHFSFLSIGILQQDKGNEAILQYGSSPDYIAGDSNAAGTAGDMNSGYTAVSLRLGNATDPNETGHATPNAWDATFPAVGAVLTIYDVATGLAVDPAHLERAAWPNDGTQFTIQIRDSTNGHENVGVTRTGAGSSTITVADRNRPDYLSKIHSAAKNILRMVHYNPGTTTLATGARNRYNGVSGFYDSALANEGNIKRAVGVTTDDQLRSRWRTRWTAAIRDIMNRAPLPVVAWFGNVVVNDNFNSARAIVQDIAPEYKRKFAVAITNWQDKYGNPAVGGGFNYLMDGVAAGASLVLQCRAPGNMAWNGGAPTTGYSTADTNADRNVEAGEDALFNYPGILVYESHRGQWAGAAVTTDAYLDWPGGSVTGVQYFASHEKSLQNRARRRHPAAMEGTAAFARTLVRIPVRIATTTNIASLSGEQTIQGVALLNKDRVGVFGQTDATANGIYTVGTPWVRASDADSSNSDFRAGMSWLVGEGDNAGQVYRLTTQGLITLGTTALTFVQVGGSTPQKPTLWRPRATSAYWPGGATTTQVMVANDLRLFYIWLDPSYAIIGLVLDISVAGTGNIRANIYADSGGRPTGLPLAEGTAVATATGTPPILLSPGVLSGVHWIGAAWDGTGTPTAPTVRAFSNPMMSVGRPGTTLTADAKHAGYSITGTTANQDVTASTTTITGAPYRIGWLTA